MKQQANVLFDTLLDTYLTKAEEFYERNMHKRDHLDLTEGLHMTELCNAIAELYRGQGRQTEALEYYKQAAFVGKLVAPDSLLVAWAFSNMGDLYQHQGKLDDALKSYQETLSIEEHVAPDNEVVAMSYETIGKILTRQGKSKEAIVAFDKAHGIACRMKH